MEQLLQVWENLETKRRVVVVLAIVAMFSAALFLSRIASNPGYALLYAGLEPGSAGEVVAALEQRGVAHQVRGDAIFVDQQMRDQLRMTLAGEGLPAGNSAGYELLDSLSGFGTTSQMFDAAYWRAKEGELARTLLAGSQIKSARVHIATPSARPFQRAVNPTASVTVRSTTGGLSPSQAKAMKYLVASAVAGMKPEDVSIIDSEGGLIAGQDDNAVFGQTGEERAQDLKRNIERMLAARVGYGNAIVEVSVATLTDEEKITERRFDPESRVAISTDNEERSTNATDSGGTPVTVASNLPTGDTGGAGGQSSNQNSETRERINYEVSETQREVHRMPGAVKRISVAVLVNGIYTPGTDGTPVWEPRPEPEMEALRELVQSAMGYDQERGDIVTLKTLAFEAIPEQGTEATLSMVNRLGLDLTAIIQIAILGIVTLLIGLFVLRPILGRQAPSGAPALGAPGLDGEIQTGDFELDNLQVVSFDSPAMGNAMGDMAGKAKGDFGQGGDESDPVARLRRMIEERQDESVEILRGWMEDGEERV